jgi:transposase-like protein
MKKGGRITKEIREELARRPKCLECGSSLVVKDGKQWSKTSFYPLINLG